MATDLDRIVRNLVTFYDFAGETILSVGAGGGQLIEYARKAHRVIAVDHDGAAVERLSARLAERGLAEKFTIIQGDLMTVRQSGDVVLFEFCLHEMPEPERALDHARKLAPDVVVIDHAPGSRWSWCAAEDTQVQAAWNAVASRPVRRQLDIKALQRLGDYSELEAKMAAQGATSLERIATYRNQQAISIPMPYRVALL